MSGTMLQKGAHGTCPEGTPRSVALFSEDDEYPGEMGWARPCELVLAAVPRTKWISREWSRPMGLQQSNSPVEIDDP
jgi:hypothetical protein